MGRGLGSVQRAVLDVIEASPGGVTADAISQHLYGQSPTQAQTEAVRRATRTLKARGLVEQSLRWERRPRKSLKRFVALTPCDPGFCTSCAERKRRVRLGDWHRRAMRTNAKHDASWLDDLTIAEASGFVHESASPDRLVDDNPDTVDMCQRRLQFFSKASVA